MTAPYYQDDAVTLYHGDCLEVMGRHVATALAITEAGLPSDRVLAYLIGEAG